MSFICFIKEKVLLLSLLAVSLLTVEIFLMIYKVHLYVKIYTFVCPLLSVFVALAAEYFVKNSFYSSLDRRLRDLDKKYLISEIIQTPEFTEGIILKETMQDAGKAMIENVSFYSRLQEDYKEYIELWIHEIKTPIAASKLIIRNNMSRAAKSIDEELDKVENYVEQALYYARSNAVEKDYVVSRALLRDIVNSAVLKNKNILLSGKVRVNLHDLQSEVYTDSKWVTFILNQIIQNSVKYREPSDSEIEIFARDKVEKTVLYIRDNGVGVKNSDLPRVFEKGFTGENGRVLGKKSTGIGLYLCSKLCRKLNIGIELNSEEDCGTLVKLVFPKGSYSNI